MNSITVAAQPAETHAGWGQLLALIGTALLFWAFTSIHKRWKETKNAPPSAAPSPALSAPTVKSVKPQVTAAVTPEIESVAAPAAVVVHQPTAAATNAALDEYIAVRFGRQSTAQIVRGAKRTLGVSESTVFRAIRKVREEATP
ncbi:hypothetical protein ACWKSP_26655 [Micromonosporaceae bacterium Da 78-11]